MMSDQEGAEPMVEQDHAEKPVQNSTKFKARFKKLRPRKVGKRMKKVMNI